MPKGPGDFQSRAVQLKWKSLYMVPANSKPNIKRVKFDQPENPSPTMQLSIPVGTQWQSNSCAYDAVVTVLFSIWQERPDSVTADWHESHSDLLDSLTQRFHRLSSMPVVSPTSSNAHFTLEKIRDSFRQHLAKISPEFTFGRYTGVHSIFRTNSQDSGNCSCHCCRHYLPKWTQCWQKQIIHLQWWSDCIWQTRIKSASLPRWLCPYLTYQMSHL